MVIIIFDDGGNVTGSVTVKDKQERNDFADQLPEGWYVENRQTLKLQDRGYSHVRQERALELDIFAHELDS